MDEKTIVLRFEAEFKSRGNAAIVDELFAPDYRGSGLGPEPVDRGGLKALGTAITAAFGDPTVTAKVEDVLVAGDRVVTRVTAQGVHRGVFQGVPPTGRPVRWSEIHIYRVRDGKIRESWSEVNMLAILMQIGALPAPAR